ncbi:MAG: IclR family transcriptional regulator [Rhodobacteraceae bacterium]|nr:IclR family transcriptional regulator [Paracoccaceae bacterium]
MQDVTKEKRKRGRPRSTAKNSDVSTVQALDRGLLVLEALADLHKANLSDLSQHVEMPPSSVHRILATLQKHSFVDFEPALQEWAVGIGAFRIGSAFLARSNLIETSQKIMRALMEETGETANLGIADCGDIVFISQVETHNPIRAFFRSGTKSPMHASGIGKAMLAHMPERVVLAILESSGQPEFTPHTLTNASTLLGNLEMVSTCGYALDNEERYLGMRCIASPIFNARGEVVAGLSVSGPSARFAKARIGEIGPIVRLSADRVTMMIGGQVPSSRLT